ncbi:uncharacterized protein LOC142231723 [Haematobia irritans]|uniref:uncharacterized protein LOC142231723 n=1 Tax=Haematobia irritans TaxID=7368 RepID=UPI003F4FC9E6
MASRACTKYIDITGDEIVEFDIPPEIIDLTGPEMTVNIVRENSTHRTPQKMKKENSFLSETQNTDCLNIMLSPGTSLIATENIVCSGDMEIHETTITYTTDANVAVPPIESHIKNDVSFGNITIFPETMNQSFFTSNDGNQPQLRKSRKKQRRLRKSKKNKGSLPNVPTTNQGQRPEITSKNQRKSKDPNPKQQETISTITKSPPFMYTKPLHAVIGGFANLTNVPVPEDIEALFSMGSMYVPPNMPTLENFIHQSRNKPQQYQIDSSMYVMEYLKFSYRMILNSMTMQRSSPLVLRLEKSLRRAYDFLDINQDLRLLESDRGKCTVLMKNHDYHYDMNYLVEKFSREGIYQPIETPYIQQRVKKQCHRKFQHALLLLIQNKISALDANQAEPYPMPIDDILDEHNTTDVKFPFLYGKVRIHKDGPLLCPVINSRGWYSYGLEKLTAYALDNVLEPYVQKYFVRDITRTASDIRNTKARDDYSFVKIKFQDLYTSIDRPAILRMLKSLLNAERFKKSTSMDTDLLVELLQMRFDHMTVFEYNGRVYRQVKGLPQGACDSKTLISLMLCYLLNLHQYEIMRYPWYSRVYMHEDEWLLYVHDNYISTLMDKLQRFMKFKFTLDIERKVYGGDWYEIRGSLTFLDIHIHRRENRFLTSYHDEINLRSNSMSYSVKNLPQKWKNYIIQGHLRRILERVSNCYLIDQLWDVERRFRDFAFRDILFYIINHYLTIYHRIMNNQLSGHYSRNPMCNFEDMDERIAILNSFIRDNFPQKSFIHVHNSSAPKRRSNDYSDNWQSKRSRMY